MKIEDMREDYDWQQVFRYTDNPSNPLTREIIHQAYQIDDIAEILATVDGENDGPDWVGAFLMKDGRYLLVRAGCDYTGWDCQAGGSAEWCSTAEELKAIATPEERERLWPEVQP